MDKIKELFDLIKKQEYDKFKKEINKNKEVDLNYKDEQGNTFLSYAVIFNQPDILKLLLDNNASIDMIDKEDRTILYYAIKFNFDKILDIILEYNDKIIGVTIHDIKDKKGRIPLHYAIDVNNMYAIKKLIKSGSNPNKTDNNGNNSLHLAVYNRNIEICKELMDYVNINQRNLLGESALHIACNLQEKDIIELLLKNNININIQDYENELTALHYAIHQNNIDIIKILLKYNPDILLQDMYGNTALHYGCIENNIQIVDKLIEYDKDININIWNIEGQIPLHIAIDREDYKKDIIDLLIKDSNLNLQDNNGNTPLLLIFKNLKWRDYEKILVKKKMDVLLENKESKRVIDYLAKTDMDDFMELLTESYLYRLQNTTTEWEVEWENLCKNELLINDNDKKKLMDKYNIVDKKNICKQIISKKIKELINNKDRTCSKRTFPIKKGYICIKLSEDKKLDICTFTGNTLDVLIGLIYIFKKYKNVCVSIDKDFRTNDELCTFYRKQGIILSNCEFLNFEIVWIYNKIHYTTNFESHFDKCKNNSKIRYIIFPLAIEIKEGSHANYLIYDKELKEIERFEPHGSSHPPGLNYNPKLLDDILENRFQKINSEIKYIRPKDYLPKIGFQTMDIYEYNKKRIGDPGGFCALWSIWWVDMRLTYKDTPRKKLVNYMIRSIKEQNMSFRNLIRNYASNIIDLRDKILNKVNKDINDWINEDITEEDYNKILDEINSLLTN